jgi:alkylglycerol monooxygenase
MAIPFFFLLMGMEALVGRMRGRKVFRGPDVVTDLSLGVMQVLAGVVGAGVLVAGYRYLYDNHRVTTVTDAAWWALPALLIGVDFFYYWFHRAAHRVNIAWASHAPHHSSEDYNLAVALRQGPVQPFFSRAFYLPLALAGFPIEMFALSSSINTLYQFWIHTELIHTFPAPIEFVFNTPSHHRVHHGCNGKYIDKNHGGILIIWDRIFGTFQPELDDEPLVYGTVKPVATWNPLLASVRPFVDVARLSWNAPRLIDKLRAPFMPPEWLPEGVTRAHVAVVAPRAKFNAPPPNGTLRYVTPMFIATLLAVVAFLVVGASKMSVGAQWGAVAWLVLSFATFGALLDGWRHARALEAVRLVAFIPLVVVTLQSM